MPPHCVDNAQYVAGMAIKERKLCWRYHHWHRESEISTLTATRKNKKAFLFLGGELPCLAPPRRLNGKASDAEIARRYHRNNGISSNGIATLPHESLNGLGGKEIWPRNGARAAR